MQLVLHEVSHIIEKLNLVLQVNSMAYGIVMSLVQLLGSQVVQLILTVRFRLTTQKKIVLNLVKLLVKTNLLVNEHQEVQHSGEQN